MHYYEEALNPFGPPSPPSPRPPPQQHVPQQDAYDAALNPFGPPSPPGASSPIAPAAASTTDTATSTEVQGKALKATEEAEAPTAREDLLWSTLRQYETERAALLSRIQDLTAEKQRLELLVESHAEEASQHGHGFCDEEVSAVVAAMNHGRGYSLASFGSLQAKAALLDGALAEGDPAAILLVIQFLERSLTRSLFHTLMKEREEAMQYHRLLLKQTSRLTNKQHRQLVQDNSWNGVILMIRRCFAAADTTQKINELQASLARLQGHGDEFAFQSHTLLQQQQLLHHQLHIEPSIVGTPVAATLYHCLWHSLNKKQRNNVEPQTLVKDFHIHEKRLLWTKLQVLARKGEWQAIKHLSSNATKGTTARFLLAALASKNSSLWRCSLPVEPFIHTIFKWNGPTELVREYLAFVQPLHRRSSLAIVTAQYDIAIQALTAEQDRKGLEALRCQLTKKLVEEPSARFYLHSIEEYLRGGSSNSNK
ncbi:spermatogenesis-defective protein 39 [Balamuthia mandrillaris]